MAGTRRLVAAGECPDFQRHGRGLAQAGRSGKSRRTFCRAAELEPGQANHFYSLGNAVYELNELERATAAFRRAVELDPRDAECWNNLGKCLKELNCLDESSAAYDHALELNPNYLLALQGRAISRLPPGRLAEGYRDYEQRWRILQPRQFTARAGRAGRLPAKRSSCMRNRVLATAFKAHGTPGWPGSVAAG